MQACKPTSFIIQAHTQPCGHVVGVYKIAYHHGTTRTIAYFLFLRTTLMVYVAIELQMLFHLCRLDIDETVATCILWFKQLFAH